MYRRILWISYALETKIRSQYYLCMGWFYGNALLWTNFKTVSDYYVILAEVDGHSERTGELVSLEKDCNEIEDYIMDNLSCNLYFLSGMWICVSLQYPWKYKKLQRNCPGLVRFKWAIPKEKCYIIKKYLPAIIDVEIEHMGHGQYLHEHSDEYASKLIEYLQSWYIFQFVELLSCYRIYSLYRNVCMGNTFPKRE